MQCCVVLLLAVLLAIRVHGVSCPSDPWIETPTSVSHVDYGSSVPPPARDNPCGSVTIVCSTSDFRVDIVVPWVSFLVNLPVLPLASCVRIWRLGPEHLSMRHTFFVWSLIWSLASYILWIAYSSSCRPHHVQFPVLLNSIYGCIVHVLLISWVSKKLSTNVMIRRLIFAVVIGGMSLLVGCVLYGFFWNRFDVPALTGWLSLTLLVLSHLFRIRATDYDNLDRMLLVLSIVGGVNCLLWLIRPNLCVTRHYKITSYLIAALRVSEAFWWLSPKIGNGIAWIEGGQEAIAVVNPPPPPPEGGLNVAGGAGVEGVTNGNEVILEEVVVDPTECGAGGGIPSAADVEGGADAGAGGGQQGAAEVTVAEAERGGALDNTGDVMADSIGEKVAEVMANGGDGNNPN